MEESVTIGQEHYLTTYQREVRETGRITFASNHSNNDQKVEILSFDPLIYTVSDFLSPEECQSYRDYVGQLESNGRPMTRSNPPKVSLDPTKLWPLPFLSLGAGVPPLIRHFQCDARDCVTASTALIPAVLVNVVGAFVIALVLAYGLILPLLQSNLFATNQRTSKAIALNEPLDMELIRPLVQRVTHGSGGHAWTHWEAPVVTRYEPGAYFTLHNDASPNRGDEWIDLGGQRLVTCICYLNTLDHDHGGGGETYFDQLGIAVTPRLGHALFFFPANADTKEADSRTTHESLPTTAGTTPGTDKWIVQMFGRTYRVPPPLGLPDHFAPVAATTHSALIFPETYE